METRAAAKRRAMAANLAENQPLKRKRVVLGELPNSPNVIVPATNLNPQKPKCLNNPKAKKAASTNKSTDAVKVKVEKVLDNDNDAKSTTNDKFNDPRSSDPFVSDIYKYLRKMEVNSGS